jgi:glycosidase
MYKPLALLITCILLNTLYGQVITLDPSNAGPDDPVKLIFNAAEGNGELVGADKVYIHHGIVIEAPGSEEWEYVIGNWGEDDGIGLMTKVDGENDKWEISFSPTIREYFRAAANESIYRISAVFRSADGQTKGTLAPGQYGWGTVASSGDYFIDLNVENYLLIKSPSEDDIFINSGESVTISGESSSSVSTMKILLDNGNGYQEVGSVSSGTTISYVYTPTLSEAISIKITATINGESLEAQSDHNIYLVSDSPVESLPAGVVKGINYHDDATKATLVLEAPGKDFIYVTGTFNDWELTHPDYLMKRTSDGELFWLELTGLTPGEEYLFQYMVNGEITVGDPYSEKIADPWNDKYIDESTYPGLLSYERTDYGPASYLQTNQSAYQWSTAENTWSRPDLDHLVIYELLVRDFIGSHSYVDLIDTLSYLKNLGVEAIELMPISEFEGNESWGYNPMYYFAPDKYYGTKDQLKEFIEVAHQMGMAVILDMVLNHAYGLNPMVRMYWDKEKNNISSTNPWFNEEYVGPYSWGYDFNHQSSYTQDFIDSVNTYWLREYHFDGYRFDFTKGFTQNESNFDGFDQDRIDVLKRMADVIWEEDQEAYIILEHWGNSTEEKELSDYGMKLWRNRVHDFYDAVVGNTSGKFSDLDDQSHVVFVGSHDEERVGYKAITGGYRSDDGSYDVRSQAVANEREKLVAAFNLLNPGPKMIWQFDELGYDISIDFNGRIGNKPLPWGMEGLGYYEDPLRKYIYDAYQGILDAREQIGPEKMVNATTSHVLNGQVRRLVYDTDGNDLVVIGNFGVESSTIDPGFTETGTWYDYFSGAEINVDNVSATIELVGGEWHIFTSERISDGLPGVIEIVSNPASIDPYPFKKSDEITITFDPSKANPEGTSGLNDANKVYMHAGVIMRGDRTDEVVNIVGTLTDDGIGEMTADNDMWKITIIPEDYFGIESIEDIATIVMYFRDETNTNVGKGFRDQWIEFSVNSSIPIVAIDPPAFTAKDEITITFNAAAGNGELYNSNKVYMHAGVDLTDTQTPWVTGWQFVVGTWGEDNGVGQMTRSTEDPSLWTITLTPSEYFGIGGSNFPKWITAVFRNADGSVKGTGSVGAFENGIIDDNLDFFILNKGEYTLFADTQTEIKVYPNPAMNYLIIERVTNEEADIRILSFSGQLIKSLKLENGQTRIDVSSLKKGIYFLQLIEGRQSKTIKLLKN